MRSLHDSLKGVGQTKEPRGEDSRIYVQVSRDSITEYIEKTDHIGPFSIDDWGLKLDTTEPVVVEIGVGLLRFEILTDQARIAV